YESAPPPVDRAFQRLADPVVQARLPQRGGQFVRKHPGRWSLSHKATLSQRVRPAALRRAQMEIDLRPELYKHYHLRSVPEKYRDQVDVRAFGTGERIVFLEYTRENFEATRQWTQAHDLFSGPPSAGYD